VLYVGTAFAPIPVGTSARRVFDSDPYEALPKQWSERSSKRE